jgi:mannose/fructose/N-acetylgalactosamine-specific phosphotransferase system component IIB
MIILLRIDDRLIHAQVVVGWGRVLKPDRFVVADDEVAASEWEKNIYVAAVPPEMKVSILSLEATVEQLRGGVFDRERIVLLVKDPASVLSMINLGLEVNEVNVGGLHYSDGREQLLDNVYIDEEMRRALRELVLRGVTLEVRALPDHESVILNSKVV